MTLTEDFKQARERYLVSRGKSLTAIRAALIDMDGVLYDSMPLHARAWHQMMEENGVRTSVDEFFLYEGMTGPATIDLIFQRELGRRASDKECKELYARKGEIFRSFGQKPIMPGADIMLSTMQRLGWKRVLVTGSAQMSLLSHIDNDYPGAFSPEDRITALDVRKGKPDPGPYLRGLGKAGCLAEEAVVVENAPLGVRAGVAAGCFTIAVTTGPVTRKEFEKEGAHIIFSSMPEFADFLSSLPQ